MNVRTDYIHNVTFTFALTDPKHIEEFAAAKEAAGL